MERSATDYCNENKPSWCNGCSFFSIFGALTELLAEKQIDPDKVNVISGIGCSSRLPLHLNTTGMHTLHGRAIAVAVGARIARPDIAVIVTAGDGDLFSIGIGHFVNAAKKNFDMTVICMDNRMYAMTSNQSSPTSPSQHSGSLTPFGYNDLPLNVLEFAISSGATFVSRTYAGSAPHLRETLSSAFNHKGFSFVEVIAPCKTFGNDFNADLFEKNLVDINKTGAYDPYNREEALGAASIAFDFDTDKNSKIPLGVFYIRNAQTFEDYVSEIKKTKSLHK